MRALGLTALPALLLVDGGLRGSGMGDEPQAAPACPAPSPATPSAGAGEERELGAFPYRLGREHRYSWLLERQKVGETTFTLTEVEAPAGSPWRREYRSSARYRYEREGISQTGEHEAYFSPTWRPLRYRTEHRYRGLRNFRSRQVQEGRLEGGRLSYEVVHNQDPQTTVRSEMAAPADAFLFSNQAIDQWAILTSRVLGEGLAEAKVLYPDFLQVYELRFRLEKEEEVARGGARTACRVYSFRSREGQLEGRVWMDPEGRMVQYQQGPLRIFLEH